MHTWADSRCLDRGGSLTRPFLLDSPPSPLLRLRLHLLVSFFPFFILKPFSAVIGVGFVGKAHLESLRRQGIPVEGVLASSPDRSQYYRDTLRVDRAYNSLDELISDKCMDVVHVCTPNNVHFEESKAAL